MTTDDRRDDDSSRHTEHDGDHSEHLRHPPTP